VDVSAFAARGTRPGGCGCPPRRTIEVGPAVGATIAIPPGAITLTYYSQLLPVDARWVDWAGAFVGAWAQAVLEPPPTLAIPSVARQVTFLGPVLGRAVFGVSA
jgi:hypothetical protein